MIVDFFGFLTPRGAGIFELADEFLFFRVDADSRVATAAKFFAFFGDVAKLLITLRMLPTGVQHFPMAS